MLKIKFWRIENVLCMKILEQNKDVFNYDFIYKASNGLNICCLDYPEFVLDEDCLYIRGEDTTYDNKVTSCEFKTVEEANEYLKKCVSAINECVAHFSKKESENKMTFDIEEFVVGDV